MSDSLPLPPRPNLEQYRKLARDFQRACKSGDANAIRAWAEGWAETIARLRNLEGTPEVDREIRADAERIERRWRDLNKTRQAAAGCTLAQAQLLVARSHGFVSWPKFAAHLDELARANSSVSRFEEAADAIVSGDLRALDALLLEFPDLARERSTREHRSTLLHYVSANGIEDFRQTTPKNIVEIARRLLAAGAEVNAESDAYGGRSTTLGLTATSYHPEKAGVQLELIELLLDHGAMIDAPDGGSAVTSCLRNGRGQAAQMLAARGARLDLEGAAGVGRLDVVRGFFDKQGNLEAPATLEQLTDGFAWACQFGHTGVVDFLLERGTKLHVTLAHHGQTGLHWAAFGGHVDIVKLLLSRGAEVDARDAIYKGTPLGWALYAWSGLPSAAERRPYYEVAALLARAGAKVDGGLYDEVSDIRMQAALRGDTS